MSPADRGELGLALAVRAVGLHHRGAPLGVRSFLASCTDEELVAVLVALAALAPGTAHLWAPALRMHTAVRQDKDAVRRVLYDLADREARITVALDLLAVIPADLDPEAALAWVDLPVQEWPDDVLEAEAARAAAGARDGVALVADVELRRRLRTLTRRPA